MSSTKYTLDRYEGDYAIFLQAGNETAQKIIHRTEMDTEVVEGDIVLINDSPAIHITVLKEETEAQRKKVANLLSKLRNRG